MNNMSSSFRLCTFIISSFIFYFLNFFSPSLSRSRSLFLPFSLSISLLETEHTHSSEHTQIHSSPKKVILEISIPHSWRMHSGLHSTTQYPQSANDHNFNIGIDRWCFTHWTVCCCFCLCVCVCASKQASERPCIVHRVIVNVLCEWQWQWSW